MNNKLLYFYLTATALLPQILSPLNYVPPQYHL